MAEIFVDATGVNPENLNKFISSGSGAISGYHLFSMYFSLSYDGADFKYKLYTNNNEVINEVYFGSLGATHTPSETNAGDGNVDKISAGKYRIFLSGVTQIFVFPVINVVSDLNIVKVIVTPNTSGAITRIDADFRNPSNVNTDPASGKNVELKLIGLYK